MIYQHYHRNIQWHHHNHFNKNKIIYIFFYIVEKINSKKKPISTAIQKEFF